MENKILIKKYENRRLYDVTHSKYVNLDEIARAVQGGSDVQVLDASSGEDITRFVMTQIITEYAKAPDSVFPLDILRQMVVASGKASQQSAMNYMRAVADMYRNALRGFSNTMTPFELMQNMMSPGANPQGKTQEPLPQPPAAPQVIPPPQGAQDNPEIQELKRRIQELEALVLNLSHSPAAAKKGGRKRTQ
jgi:polyhydroxyalkanoate synthesis repressor PhaR